MYFYGFFQTEIALIFNLYPLVFYLNKILRVIGSIVTKFLEGNLVSVHFRILRY